MEMNKKFNLNIALIIVLWSQFLFTITNIICEYIYDFTLFFSRSLWGAYIVSNLFDLLITFIGVKILYNHFKKMSTNNFNLTNKLVFSIVAVILIQVVGIILSEFDLYFKNGYSSYNDYFYKVRIYTNRLIYFLELLIFILVFYKKVNWKENESTLDSNF